MLEAVRRYATKVLLIHLVLAIVLVCVVLAAARDVYFSALGQATDQSKERLALLGQQTARGIENHYLSIMSDLELILWDESVTAETQPAEQAGVAGGGPPLRDRQLEGGPPPREFDSTRPAPGPSAATMPGGAGEPRLLNRLLQRNRPPGGAGGGGPGGAGRFNPQQFVDAKTVAVNGQLTAIMWRQLRGRVSSLFLVDDETGRVVESFPENSRDAATALAKEQLPWFKDLKMPSLSHLQRAGVDGEGASFHLIAVPARTGAGPGRVGRASTVVAVVPTQSIKEQFFDPLNEQGVVNAALLDDSGTALISMDPKFVGMNVLERMDPAVREQVSPVVMSGKAGAVVVPMPYSIGEMTFPARILEFVPIEGLPGRQWTVLTSAPLSDSEALVNNVFRGALLWAIFVSLSGTGILVSTSVFMIRSRMKFERARHEVLTRELAQARQIQLAWLPDGKNVPEGLEVSAANLPASHISGDFYNWFHLPALAAKDGGKSVNVLEDEGRGSGKIAIVIGDVTGHGMAAAFLMATAQLLVRTTLLRYQDPGRCLQEVNRQLCMQGFQGQFVTMLVIVLDPVSSSIEIATAGHPAPLVERGGKFESLKMEPQLVLGVDATETYRSEGFILEPGAAVMLYTDGVIEAVSPSGEQYGVERLVKALEGERAGIDPQGRIGGVLEDVKRFCFGRELLDDVTMVAVRTRGAAAEVVAQAMAGG